LDMSDSILRSVSPIHLQYLKNMNVAASASISIVKDGILWGLIACHNETPLRIAYDIRAACRTLVSNLARQIKTREEAEAYRERLRLRGSQDDTMALLSRHGSLEEEIVNHVDDLSRLIPSDGFAVLRGQELLLSGTCPPEEDVRKLADWLIARSVESIFSTNRLIVSYPAAEQFQGVAAGVLSVLLSVEERWLLVWFRAEEVQIVKWAGNPHKAIELKPGETLSPRSSFEAWQETVHGHSRRWTLAEVEAVGRFRRELLEFRQNRRLRELNRQLIETGAEKDLLLNQKQFLIGEVNHRVQNSLQIVSSFLSFQARESGDVAFTNAIEEARRRISAVSLLHRSLYRGDEIGVTDAGRYIEDLCGNLIESMGKEWKEHFVLDLRPVMLPIDRVIPLGLVVTELVINVNKYAYSGEPGPIEITLTEYHTEFRLVVADKGKGRTSARQGFGTRMMTALVSQLSGHLDFEDNAPGVRVVLSAPIALV
jgi:two-component system, chemotaxis family, sensor kinase Cph1